ncbi:hypothetical protein G6F59_016409 [Rhizopus arrhizus]|nr:hypothetical protein G6F59_016409 [Rhizopus arrhizus]
MTSPRNPCWWATTSATAAAPSWNWLPPCAIRRASRFTCTHLHRIRLHRHRRRWRPGNRQLSRKPSHEYPRLPYRQERHQSLPAGRLLQDRSPVPVSPGHQQDPGQLHAAFGPACAGVARTVRRQDRLVRPAGLHQGNPDRPVRPRILRQARRCRRAPVSAPCGQCAGQGRGYRGPPAGAV